MAASFETLSVTAEVGISSALIDGHEDGATVVIEVGSCRYRADGTAPTTTTGILVSAGDVIELFGGEVADFQIISTSGTATVHVHTFVRGR